MYMDVIQRKGFALTIQRRFDEIYFWGSIFMVIVSNDDDDMILTSKLNPKSDLMQIPLKGSKWSSGNVFGLKKVKKTPKVEVKFGR